MDGSILEISRLLRERRLSPVELTEDCLARIAKLDGSLNAFITLTAEAALDQARHAEDEIRRRNWRGPLHGIPIALKDLIETAGVRTTAASALFKERIPKEDAEIVRRLKDAGAILLGKQNLHEFAYGGSSLISYYGEVRNPWNLEHIAGGSSGGSAAGVAAGLCYAAIGTDTAGSIREPAAQCGIVGLKPTYGRVSCRGVIPLSPSLDHVGPIARSVADAAVILQTIAGYDPKDAHSANVPVHDYIEGLNEKRTLRVGIPRRFFCDELSAEVASSVEQALRALKPLTQDVCEIDLAVPTDRTLQAAESYAYHADYVERSPQLYQSETLRRIRTGENITAAQIEQARRELQELRNSIAKVFREVDVLVTPTVPVPAPNIAQLKRNPEQLRPAEILLLRNTRPFNVWGLPAISIPCGFTSGDLPIGLQIVGPPWQEATVLRIAHAFEQATEWHKRKPPIAK